MKVWNKGLKGRQPWHNTDGLKPGWNKGLPAPWAKNNPQTFRKGHIPWNTGLTISDERIRAGIEKLRQGRIRTTIWNKGKKCPQWSDSKHWNWNNGKTTENEKLRHSLAYREWQQKVYIKYRWTCRLCGIHCQKREIVAHHIYPFDNFEKKRFDVQNGIVLCRKCHKLLHSLKVNDLILGNINNYKIYVKRNIEN